MLLREAISTTRLDARTEAAPQRPAFGIRRPRGSWTISCSQVQDDRTPAAAWFDLGNIIVEQLISAPKHAQAVYTLLPESKRVAAEQRDSPQRPHLLERLTGR